MKSKKTRRTTKVKHKINREREGVGEVDIYNPQKNETNVKIHTVLKNCLRDNYKTQSIKNEHEPTHNRTRKMPQTVVGTGDG